MCIRDSYVSATPADYELSKTEGLYTEQIIRPTGLLDPIIEVKPSEKQIDDLINEIQIRVVKNERILVTTLTKRMAEELSKYLDRFKIKSRYIHSDVDTIESCLLYTSPSPRDATLSRMPSSA